MTDTETKESRVQPIVILPLDTMSAEHQQLLRDNGICVVECSDPDLVRFLEPPPADYSVAERAAIELFRRVRGREGSLFRSDLNALYIDILLRGSKMERPPEVPKPAGRKGNKP